MSEKTQSEGQKKQWTKVSTLRCPLSIVGMFFVLRIIVFSFCRLSD